MVHKYKQGCWGGFSLDIRPRRFWHYEQWNCLARLVKPGGGVAETSKLRLGESVRATPPSALSGSEAGPESEVDPLRIRIFSRARFNKSLVSRQRPEGAVIKLPGPVLIGRFQGWNESHGHGLALFEYGFGITILPFWIDPNTNWTWSYSSRSSSTAPRSHHCLVRNLKQHR